MVRRYYRQHRQARRRIHLSHEDFHRSSQKITEFVPGKKVVWHVLDSYLGFVKDKTEWNGTDIVFEITKKDNKTQLTFTHVGLVPDFEYYDDCSNAWGSYVNGSQETDNDRQGKTQQERVGNQSKAL